MSFFDRLKETAFKAADKAKEQVEVVRLHTQISGKRREIDKLYTAIGEEVYKAHQANQPHLADQIIATNSELIINIQHEIEELELKVSLLKDEKECECGQLLPNDAKFCSACGHRFNEQQATIEKTYVTLPSAEHSSSATESVKAAEFTQSQTEIASSERLAMEQTPSSEQQQSSAVEQMSTSSSTQQSILGNTVSASAQPEPQFGEQVSELTNCPVCEAELDPDNRFCEICGTRIK